MQHTIIHCETPYVSHSLVPRPHPLTRRNDLVNQVEFLGLETFCSQPAQKGYSNGDEQILVLGGKCYKIVTSVVLVN